MAAQGTYRARGLVLRRTKLGETDLIVTLLCEGEARQVRAVAKGARRPGSRLTGVVDLGNEGSFLLNRGRNLDVVSEGRLLVSRAGLAADLGRSVHAAAVLDVAAGLTDEGDPDTRLYPMTCAALDAMAAAPEAKLAAVTAAYALKAACAQGFRPELGRCVRCGESVSPGGGAGEGKMPQEGQAGHGGCAVREGQAAMEAQAAQEGRAAQGGQSAQERRAVLFDFLEGGVVCAACADAGSARPVDTRVLLWARALIGMRFSDILAMEPMPGEERLWHDVLSFSAAWLEHYPGIRPRALAFVLSGAMW